ncbi:MAG: glycosyltransferase family 39 protein [Chloroflexota bacterium]
MKGKLNFPEWKNWLIVLIFMGVFIFPRVFSLGTYATADEPAYLRSSGSFYYLLKEGRFAETDLIIHPGVINLWAGALGYYTTLPEYAEHPLAQYPISDLHFRQIIERSGHVQMELLAISRAMTVLIQALILGAALFYGLRVLGRWPAVIGFSLICFDPFYFANSRILQPDGILAASILLSVLAYLDYLKTGKRSSLLVSGAAAGLGWLSKLVGIVLGPMILGVGGYAWWRNHRGDRRKAFVLFRDLALWLVIALIVFAALWPVMWVEPITTLVANFKQTFLLSSEVNSPMFFNGRLNQEGEFGLGYFYYYLVAIYNYTTPLILFGLGLLGVFWRGRKASEQEKLSFAAVGLSIVLLIFLTVMTFSSKKAERYVVTAFILLDLLAGVGYWFLVNKVLTAYPRVRSWAAAGGMVVIIGLQALLVLNTAPYYHSYFNPMRGSSERFSQQFQVGWGEGLDEAARYLNEQEGIKGKTVFTWYSATFDLFYNQRSIEFHIPPTLLDVQFEEIMTGDYAIVYISQWQRQPETKLIQFLIDKEPEYTVNINGFEYVKVYNLNTLRAEPGD